MPDGWARFGQILAGPDTADSLEIDGMVDNNSSEDVEVRSIAEARFGHGSVYYSQP